MVMDQICTNKMCKLKLTTIKCSPCSRSAHRASPSKFYSKILKGIYLLPGCLLKKKKGTGE